MADHPINNIMDTAMINIKEMIDVDTIIGNPVQTPDGSVIIPVSRVSFGLAAGGAEYGGAVDFAEQKAGDKVIAPVKYPFAGGSGAGVSISPVAFIVAGSGNIELMPIANSTAIEKLVDMIPDVVNKINKIITDKMNVSKTTGNCDCDQQGQMQV
ncbi:MAG: GerW family sporulation protein [Clostridia bacterium]|nr:GerW family sporulation protein [Clostridia bacterium]